MASGACLGDEAFGFGAFELGFDPLEAVAFGSGDAGLCGDERDAGARDLALLHDGFAGHDRLDGLLAVIVEDGDVYLL